MTKQKHLKQRVRERMAKTGERYATARRHVIAHAPRINTGTHAAHVPGCTPAATALRIIAAASGVTTADSAPISEGLMFTIAGGIGIGVMSFRYEAEDFSSIYLAGRNQWWDDLAHITDACQRLGLTPQIMETGGAKRAESQLREALADGRPVMAWVDLSHLPWRGMPEQWSGGGYHMLTVYSIDDATGTALVGDMTDEPVEITLDDLATSRARIGKQKHRLLTLPAQPDEPTSLEEAVRAGLAACHDGLVNARNRSMTLDALEQWAGRLAAAKGKDAWVTVFRRGHHFWMGLWMICEFAEYYNTGGGLSRPLFASGLRDAAELLGAPDLNDIAAQYEQLGEEWSDLAAAALPDAAPQFAEARQLFADKAERAASADADAPEAIRAMWKRLYEIGEAVSDSFPLTEEQCAALRTDLAERVARIHEHEVAAHAALGAWLEGARS